MIASRMINDCPWKTACLGYDFPYWLCISQTGCGLELISYKKLEHGCLFYLLVCGKPACALWHHEILISERFGAYNVLVCGGCLYHMHASFGLSRHPISSTFLTYFSETPFDLNMNLLTLKVSLRSSIIKANPVVFYGWLCHFYSKCFKKL